MQDARGRSTRSSKRFDTVPDPPSVPDNDTHSGQGDTGQYICIECSETFDTKLELNNHRQSHVTQKQFTCSHCGRGFHHQVFLEMHERSHEGRSSPTLVTRTPGRVISTRSSKAVSSLTTDVVHVLPVPPKQPGHLVNSTVDFRERKVGPAFTPLECVTRRTQDTSQASCQRRDPPERKNRFELRIAKVLDSTIHIIDPYGNTLEILSDVFNKYTICDPEQDPPTGDLSAEDAETQENTSVSGPQEVSSEPLLPQTEPDETEDATEMEEGPPCHSSPSPSDKPLDDREDSATLPAPVSSDKEAGSLDHDHSTIQPDPDIPKNSASEIPETTTVAQNDSSLKNQIEEKLDPNHETETDSETKASDVSPVDNAALHESAVVSVSAIDNAHLDIVDDGCSALHVDLLDQERDPTLINSDITSMESSSPVGESLVYETPATDLPEKVLQDDGNPQNDAAEKGIGFLLNMNRDGDQLDALCDSNTTKSNTSFDMSLSGWEALSRRVNHGQILDQQSDTETSDLGDSKPEETVTAFDEDERAPKLNLSSSQDPSYPEDLNYICDSKTEENVSSGEPDLTLSNPVEPSEKDAGNHDMEENRGQEISSKKDAPEGQPNLDNNVAQDEKSSVFSAESCVSPPEHGSLSQIGSSDGDKKPISLVEDEENFMIEQMDTDLSERDDRDLFDGRDILPLDAQVEVGEKIHITHESNVAFEKELDHSIEANKAALEHCLNKHDNLTETVRPENIIPINEVTHKKNTTDDEIVKTDLQHAWLRTDNEDQEICQVSAPCQDAEPENPPADTEEGLEDSAENSDSHEPSATIALSAALLPSEKPQDARDEKPAPSPASLAQESLSKDIAHQLNPDQMQVITPDIHPVPETFMPSIVESDSRTVKDKDETVSEQDNVDSAERNCLPEGTSINTEIKVSDEGLTTVLHSSSLLSVTDAESEGQLEPGDGSASPHEEVSMADDVNEGISEDQENILPEQNPQIEQQDENQSSHELCTLQSLELKINDEDTDTVSPGPTKTVNEDNVHKMTFAERDLDSDGLRNERAEGASEHVLEGDSGKIQDESKDNHLDDSLSREHLEKPQISPVSSVDAPLNESEENDQETDVEISPENTGPVPYIPLPGDGASTEEPAGDISGATTPSPKAVSQKDPVDVPEALLLTDDADIKETTEVKSPDGSLGASSQCLKCGRRVRRGRKETIWTQVCYKCRLVEKRKERHTNKETSKEEYESLSDFQIKQEADKDDVSEEPMRPTDEKEEESAHKKPYNCQKCDQSFRIPALLAGHMKYHTLPQCLTCGCPMKLKYKTRRIVRRCQKCVQEIKEQRKDLMNDENSGDEESLKSDDETLESSVSDNQSDVLEGDLSESEVTLTSLKPHKKVSTKCSILKAKGQPARLSRGRELVRSVLLKKHKKGKHGLYCACPASRKSACKRPMKRCPHCQKLRGRRFNPLTLEREELQTGHPSDHSDISHDSDHALKKKLRKDFTEGKRKKVKRVKKPLCSGSEVLGGSSEMVNSMTESDVISCKKEDSESSSDEQVISDLGFPDGEKPRLCPQCGKAFKCNRSLNLHLLSHNAIACESCGCRLQKRRRSGRWSKKCRICRLGGKPGRDSADDDITSETSLQLKVKQTKIGKNKKLQTISKHKKDLKWMNMMLAVKGLKRKRELKNLARSSSEPEDDAPTVIDEKFSVVAAPALPKCDVDFQSMQQPGPSGLHSTPKKRGRKCLYREKNIIKVEENPLLSDLHNLSASMMPVSIKQEEEIQCLECNQNFQTFDLLLIHQQSHVEGQPYSCPECPQTFSTEQYLTIHLNAHPEGRPFRCPECNKTFTRRNHLGVHLRVHSGIRPFACPDCPCKFRQKSSLIIHRYTHRNTDVLVLKPYQCSVCGKSFKQLQRLIIHERLHTGECPFSCKDCEQVFPSKARLYMHRKIHKMSAVLPEAEPTLERKDNVEIQSFQCTDCDKVCSTKASFVLHRKVHRPLSSTSKQSSGPEQNAEERSFHCKKCDKVFSSKARLSLHKKLHLKADIRGKPFICKVCNKACSTKASFVLHSKVHKTLLKASMVHQTFHCKECDVVSPNKASFILHSKMHKSARAGSFICKDCDKVCSTKASLVLHRRVHKSLFSNEQGQNLGGDVTEQDSSQEQLSDHNKSHTQPEESHDPEQHPSNEETEEPQKTDVNEKPFACPSCPMRFTRLKILVRHKQLHGDDGLFCCVHCGKRFLYQKSFLNHGNICKSRNKGKSLLGHKKVTTKRKAVKDGDPSLDQANMQKKRKIAEKKTMSEAQKEKNKALKAKKLALIKEKSKIKAMKEKKKQKEKKSKAGAENVSETSHGKQEKPADSLPKEKKPKDVTKGQKTVKKMSLKEKQQKSKSIKKWQIIASSAVQKRKLQAAITAGKKKVVVKKKGPGKARPGGKEKN